MSDTTKLAQQIYQEGLVLVKFKHYTDALSCFEQVVDINPPCAQVWFQIGYCRSELVKLEIKNSEEYLYVDTEAEHYQEVIKAYQKAIELQPDYADARNSLAELFSHFGERQSEDVSWPSDYMRAIEWYKQAAEVSLDGATAYHHQIGWVYTCLMENFDDDVIRDQVCFEGTVGIAEARIETYQQLADMQPDDAKAYYELGEAYKSWIYAFITECQEYVATGDEIEAMKEGKHPEIQDVLKKAIKVFRTAVQIIVTF